MREFNNIEVNKICGEDWIDLLVTFQLNQLVGIGDREIPQIRHVYLNQVNFQGIPLWICRIMPSGYPAILLIRTKFNLSSFGDPIKDKHWFSGHKTLRNAWSDPIQCDGCIRNSLKADHLALAKSLSDGCHEFMPSKKMMVSRADSVKSLTASFSKHESSNLCPRLESSSHRNEWEQHSMRDEGWFNGKNYQPDDKRSYTVKQMEDMINHQHLIRYAPLQGCDYSILDRTNEAIDLLTINQNFKQAVFPRNSYPSNATHSLDLSQLAIRLASDIKQHVGQSSESFGISNNNNCCVHRTKYVPKLKPIIGRNESTISDAFVTRNGTSPKNAASCHFRNPISKIWNQDQEYYDSSEKLRSRTSRQTNTVTNHEESIDERGRIFLHLCQLFPESNVRLVMENHPYETDTKIICSHLVRM